LLYLLVTLLIGVGAVFSIELGLRVFDLGDPNLRPDPFVGFSSTRPLFALNGEGTRYEIAPSRRTFFYYDSFPSRKADDEFRIFCLGGSTVAGRPYGIETSFTTWLELGLEAADPSRNWEVVNCGGISYASYRLVPVLEEVLNLAPDLIVLMTGHNEFLEDRTYGHIRRLPQFAAAPYDWISRTWTFTLLRGLFEPDDSEENPGQTILPTEVQALLDYKGGLEKYRRDEASRASVLEHFNVNLERMVGLAARAGVPILLVNPGCNLRDTPPFKSEHRNDLTEEQLLEWNLLRRASNEISSSDPPGSLDRLKKAVEIDDQHAGTLYRLGQMYDSMGRVEEARWAYEMAKEFDVCPLRILTAMNRAIAEIEEEADLPGVDAGALLADRCSDRIPGDEVYLDHVHPTFQSHQLIANALIERMSEAGLVEPEEDWPEKRDGAYAAHSESLDEVYFAKGQIRLEKLRSWAAGRSDIELSP
jgi:lysophospholipase L1-like esterase